MDRIFTFSFFLTQRIYIKLHVSTYIFSSNKSFIPNFNIHICKQSKLKYSWLKKLWREFDKSFYIILYKTIIVFSVLGVIKYQKTILRKTQLWKIGVLSPFPFHRTKDNWLWVVILRKRAEKRRVKLPFIKMLKCHTNCLTWQGIK